MYYQRLNKQVKFQNGIQVVWNRKQE